VMPSKANVATIHVADYDIWHKQLGHVSPKVLSKMPTSTQKFPQVQTLKFIPICPGCAEGKMKSQSFLESQSCAMRLFELIHSDLKSLLVEFYHWFKYFIVFIDDKSSHMWTANLRKKSDVSKSIRNFKAMARIQHGATIRRWQINQGGEFINSDLMDTLKGLGIVIEQSVPHQHQQNGRAERAIRTIIGKAQCLCFTAHLPQSWWEFCVNHTVYLINRTSIAHLEWQTPMESLIKVKPDLSELHVFSCGAYVFLLEEVRANKLAPRSELMTYVRYETGVKGWHFMR